MSSSAARTGLRAVVTSASGRAFSIACRSSMCRNSNSCKMSCGDHSVTLDPRRGRCSTSPCCPSSRNASRSGARLMPNPAHNCSSTILSPGCSAPLSIASRIRLAATSTRLTGRPSPRTARFGAATGEPIPSVVGVFTVLSTILERAKERGRCRPELRRGKRSIKSVTSRSSLQHTAAQQHGQHNTRV